MSQCPLCGSAFWLFSESHTLYFKICLFIEPKFPCIFPNQHDRRAPQNHLIWRWNFVLNSRADLIGEQINVRS